MRIHPLQQHRRTSEPTIAKDTLIEQYVKKHWLMAIDEAAGGQIQFNRQATQDMRQVFEGAEHQTMLCLLRTIVQNVQLAHGIEQPLLEAIASDAQASERYFDALAVRLIEQSQQENCTAQLTPTFVLNALPPLPMGSPLHGVVLHWLQNIMQSEESTEYAIDHAAVWARATANENFRSWYKQWLQQSLPCLQRQKKMAKMLNISIGHLQQHIMAHNFAVQSTPVRGFSAFPRWSMLAQKMYRQQDFASTVAVWTEDLNLKIDADYLVLMHQNVSFEGYVNGMYEMVSPQYMLNAFVKNADRKRVRQPMPEIDIDLSKESWIDWTLGLFGIGLGNGWSSIILRIRYKASVGGH